MENNQIENIHPEKEVVKKKKKGFAKKFFASIFFRIILIAVLEIISFMLWEKLFLDHTGGEFTEPFKSKGFWIYYGICFVLSITTLSRIGKRTHRNIHSGTPGVTRIMSEQQYNEEQLGKSAKFVGIMVVVSFFLAPFVAPFNLGTLIHKAIRGALQ